MIGTRNSFGLVAFAGLLATMSTTAGEYIIDGDHSHVGFQVRHMGVSNVRGNFTEFEGSFTLNDKSNNLEAMSGTVKVASIDTGHKDRDGHLTTKNKKTGKFEFFNPEASAEISFKMAEYVGTGTYARLTGTLTMNGKSKPITIGVQMFGVAEDPWGNQRAGFSGNATINRKDFDLVYDGKLKSGKSSVGDSITIQLEIEGILKK